MQYLRQSTASQEAKLGVFLDSTDGNTAETGLTIANTDIKLTKGGATTEVNKNSGGGTHVASGRYSIVFDATDTDTLGNLEVDCHVVGALAVHREYIVLTATAYDALLTGTFNNLGGVAQTEDNNTKITIIDTVVDAIKAITDQFTFTSANQVDANMLAISSDGPAADNLESQYDTTGLTGDTFPSTQSQVGSLASGTAAISKQAESYTLTTGTQSSGTVSDTEMVDGIYHEHTDTAGALELYYQFDVGGTGIGVDVTINGRINGANDSLDGVYAYNWLGVGWDRIGDYDGQSSSTDKILTYPLLVRNTGAGANLGKVRIRFFSASGLTSSVLRIDKIFASYAVVSQSVGYADGAIWLNTNTSNTNTELFVDGTADNPVSTWSAALTISSALGVTRFRVINGSSITLTANSDNYTILGNDWVLALGGQSIAAIHVEGASVSGVGIGASRPNFRNCDLGTLTLPPFHAVACSLNDTITFSAGGDYAVADSHSGIAGSGTPIIDTGAAIVNVNLTMPNYHQGIEIQNLNAAGVDLFSISGVGQIIYAASSSGTVNERGDWKATNTGGVTIVRDDNTQGLLDIKGSTFNTSTDSLEAIRNRGDSAWKTATGFNIGKTGYTLTVQDWNTVAPDNAGVTANGVAIAALNNITAADVWTSGTRTVTAFSFSVDIQSINGVTIIGDGSGTPFNV